MRFNGVKVERSNLHIDGITIVDAGQGTLRSEDLMESMLVDFGGQEAFEWNAGRLGKGFDQILNGAHPGDGQPEADRLPTAF